jgi:molecular chaperone HscB
VQQAARVNEAFRVLKSPLARARYLLEIAGLPLDDTDTAMDPGFLMQQMELREALEGVRHSTEPFKALEQVRNEIEGAERQMIGNLGRLFDQEDRSALEQARQEVRKLQFMQRLLQEVDELEEELVHESQTPD